MTKTGKGKNAGGALKVKKQLSFLNRRMRPRNRGIGKDPLENIWRNPGGGV